MVLPSVGRGGGPAAPQRGAGAGALRAARGDRQRRAAGGPPGAGNRGEEVRVKSHRRTGATRDFVRA